MSSNESFIRELLNASKDAGILLSLEGIILACNTEAALRLGSTVSTLIGKNFFDLIPRNVINIYRQFQQKSVNARQCTRIEVNRDGIWYDIIGCPVKDLSGKITAIGVFSRNITEHKNIEKKLLEYQNKLELMVESRTNELRKALRQLQESEHRFRTVADYTYNWEYWRLPDGSFAYISPSAERITGYSPQEFTENDSLEYDIVHSEDREMYRSHIKADFEFESDELKYRILHRDGSIRWIHHICTAMRSKGGAFLGIRASNWDITEQMVLEKQKEENQRIFRLLIDNIGEFFFLIESEARKILFASSALETVTGFKMDIFIEKSLYTGSSAFETMTGLKANTFILRDRGLLNYVLPEDIERLGMEPGWFFQWRAVDEEMRIIDARKEIKWVRIRTFPFKSNDGEKLIAGIVSDITPQKLAEERERIHAEQLRQADKMASLGVLVSGVAHEINNPNNFISMNAPMLKDAWESIVPILQQYYNEHGDYEIGGVPCKEMLAVIPELFQGIVDGSKRIGAIVADLKNYARKDESAFTDQVCVNESLTEAINLLGSLIKKSTSEFYIELPEHDVWVLGNKQKLEQVIINLVQNACESLQSNSDRIVVSLTEKNGFAIMEVVDEGYGIPKDQLSQITDPFFTTRRSSGGTGLGLSVSAGIIKEHKGTLEFESVEGKGTTVRLHLPVLDQLLSDKKS